MPTGNSAKSGAFTDNSFFDFEICFENAKKLKSQEVNAKKCKNLLTNRLPFVIIDCVQKRAISSVG